MSTKRIVFRNTTAQIIGKIIGAGTTFIVSLVIARLFGATGYGDFVKVTTYIALFFLIADFGLNAIFLQKPQNLLGTLVGLRVVGSIGLIFLAIAILNFIPQGTTQGYTSIVRFGIILFAPAIFFQALITTTNAVFQREFRYELSTIAITAGSIATLSLLWFFSKNNSLGAVVPGVLVILVGSAVTAFVSLGLVRKFQTIQITLQPKMISQLIVPSIPLGLTLLFNLVYVHLDSVVITLTRQTVEVGVYGLAYRIFEVALVLPTFFMNAVYPFLLQAKTNSQDFLKIIKKSLIFLFSTSLIVFIVLWICSPLLVMVREDFALSIQALRVLSLGLPFFFVSALTMWALIALGNLWILFCIYAFGMIVNLFLSIWFIPIYGFMAAAWITVVGEGVIVLLSAIVLKRAMVKT